MLGDFLRAIFGMINRKEYHQAQDKLNEAFVTLLKKDATFFDGIAVEELMAALMQEPNFTEEYMEILAELLYARAMLSEAQHKKAESADNYRKSLILFEYVDDVGETFSFERQSRINSIREKLNLA